ncbi:isocitrate dehydrogenase [Culex quinquefasciatus]|uniref:Isocitrate dehydrogenase n=1 Tax=Culex quinquefasciatus TaxID=7176 RepID=B0WQY5_CULQU|nr:isocitrate dehydrogenase [Culex quinquefasciatus]|eukprot:XP_001851119.1 isocitrate dehydrogenase [Culex quinquefasciatus]
MALRLFRAVGQDVVAPMIFKRGCAVSAYELQHKVPVQRKVEQIPKAQYGGRHTIPKI